MKAHQLIKFTTALYSKPHLINQVGFDAVSAYLSSRNNLMVPMDEPSDMPMEPEAPDDLDDFDPESGVGVIDVCGALTYKSINGMCGTVGCSYEGILDQLDEMLEAGAKIIVLNCDSPGGEGYGAFETADEMRKKCDAVGAKMYSYNDGCMASACYALACAADEVISNPGAETGSIGVLIALMNDSQMLANMGLVRSFISAGDSKIPFDESGDWKESFIEDLQAKVDALYSQFCNHVSSYTSMSVQAVKDTQAKMFNAEDAMKLGLINKTMTRSEFVDYIITKQQGAM